MELPEENESVYQPSKCGCFRRGPEQLSEDWGDSFDDYDSDFWEKHYSGSEPDWE